MKPHPQCKAHHTGDYTDGRAADLDRLENEIRNTARIAGLEMYPTPHRAIEWFGQEIEILRKQLREERRDRIRSLNVLANEIVDLTEVMGRSALK